MQSSSIIDLLKACSQRRDIREGIRLHADIRKCGLVERDPYIPSCLVSMYAKCGDLATAHELIEELPVRNIVSWNALISGYTQQAQREEGLNCLRQMQHEGVCPNAVTFICILKACGHVGAIDCGKQIHSEVVSLGLLGKDVVLGNSLVDMYAKCGALAKARDVLEALTPRDVVSWNTLMAGYAQIGQGNEALDCFEQIYCEGLSPDIVTFICALRACGSIGSTNKGKQIHDEIAIRGLLGNNIMLGTALVDMYIKCGELKRAEQALRELPVRDIVSWNAIITGYAQHEQGEEALKCFQQMEDDDILPDATTFASILKACGSIGAIDKGEQIYGKIFSRGLLGSDVVLGTALVDMYGKCGVLAKAQQLLLELPIRNIVSWSALITGYVQQGLGDEALNSFDLMLREGFSPNAVTFACILKACGSVGALDKGKQIHCDIVNQGLLEGCVVVGGALVDMYAKCGLLAEAQQVLDQLPIRSVVSWNALITGYGQQVLDEEALNCFKRMQEDGLSPDIVTFTSVLNACSRIGLLNQGQMYLEKMSEKHGIRPGIEHLSCLADLFARAGHLDKAMSVIMKMPSSEDFLVCSALLAACQKWGNVNLGKWAFEQAILKDEKEALAYVCMSNIYVAAGMEDDANNIEAMRLKNALYRKL